MSPKKTVTAAIVLTTLTVTTLAQGYDTECSSNPLMGTVNCKTNPSGGSGGGYLDLMAFQRGAAMANMQNQNDSLMQQNMLLQQQLMQQQKNQLSQQSQTPTPPSYQLGQLQNSWKEQSVKVCRYIPSLATAFTVHDQPQADLRLHLNPAEDCAPRIMLSMRGDFYKPLR